MWGARYWGTRYWGARYWGKVGAASESVPVSVRFSGPYVTTASRSAPYQRTFRATRPYDA